MKKNQKKETKVSKKHLNNIPQDDDASLSIVSSTECTGMLYKPPLTDENAKGYTDIYHVQQQKDQPSPTDQKKAAKHSKTSKKL